MTISNYDDIIDSRDVIARLEELQDEQYDLLDDPEGLEAWEADNLEELTALKELAREGADCAADWEYGETLIRDSYFEKYAQDLAEDIGAIDRNASWPLGCIDWEQAARELQMDYIQIDFDGVTYWVR